MRHMITLKDWSPDEIRDMIRKAIDIKKNIAAYGDVLKGKTLVMLFQKTSTRTRLSFEDGMNQLGGHAIFVDMRTTQFKMADLKDEIRATERFADAIFARVKKNSMLQEMAQVVRTPIINGCCEKYHPCQGLADVMTMVEASGGLEGFRGKKVVWLGITNNVSNSLVMATVKLGGRITLCIRDKNPPAIDPELEKYAKETGLYEETDDVSCIKDADFIHTDTWVDMEFFDSDGEVIPEYRTEYEKRKKMFMPLQLSRALLDKYGSKAKIMHCMPCHIGYEITRDAIDHPDSLIFDQAENRLHAQKALLLKLMGVE
ncbi:ornithine carbamoyltransferase [Candidatus Woesearchaeota archaeon]|nr:ornithine carbamoyltransferase [Candidatus Woesearchaeota archaeon]